jgi:opacity protein-like surface antigen
MKIKFFVMVTLFSGAATLSRAEYFVRPIVANVDIRTAGYTNATSLGFCAGYFWDGEEPSMRNEISLEYGSATWKFDFYGQGYAIHASEQHQPIFMNFRVHGSGEWAMKNLRFYLGPCLGWTYSTGRATATGSVIGSANISAWNFTYGGSAGFNYRISRLVDVDVGYRYLHIAGGAYTTDGITVTTESAGARILYAGIGFHF